MNVKKNSLVLLFKTIFKHGNCFLSSDATDGEDWHGLKLRKVRANFSSFNAAIPVSLVKFVLIICLISRTPQ